MYQYYIYLSSAVPGYQDPTKMEKGSMHIIHRRRRKDRKRERERERERKRERGVRERREE